LPQLLLLDLKLPRMTGLEVLAWLQTWPGAKRFPTIALTGSAHDADVRKAYELGAYTFLRKPAELNELAFALKNIDEFLRTSTNLPPSRPPFRPSPQNGN
jgi:CheY-like chemotaxis protein